MPATARGTLLIVGDIHRSWSEADAPYLEAAGATHVLFVGDLGDEDVEMVERVAALQVEKSVVLGNHDAWASFKAGKATDKLRRSLEILGEDHIGFARRELPALGVTLIGARPFSWGGPSLRSVELYKALYGISTVEESSRRIVDLARDAHHRDVVILAHNGPTGLGDAVDDIYGKDFGRPGGDWGDQDLQIAITRIKELGLRVPLVIAGHMHSQISGRQPLRRRRMVEQDGTVYVNPAEVPRVVPRPDGTGDVRHYTEVRMEAGKVAEVRALAV
jgi:uncharacterized protein (TIGR04168 family)